MPLILHFSKSVVAWTKVRAAVSSWAPIVLDFSIHVSTRLRGEGLEDSLAAEPYEELGGVVKGASSAAESHK
jgi:hypothetical protein